MTELAARVRRKRGRKFGDSLDSFIREKRRNIVRGIQFILQESPSFLQQRDVSIDELTRVVLNRELDLVRRRQLIEIREISNIEASNLPSNTVAARLAIPSLSCSKCLNSAMSHLHHFETVAQNQGNLNPSAFFTPEAYILLSKACEQMIIELASRSFISSALAGTGCLVDAQDLADAIRSSWKSRDREYSASGSFDFLIDVLDRYSHSGVTDPLDYMAEIHKT